METVPRPPDRNSIVLSRETTQPAKVVDAEPVKIESPRRRTVRSTAKMPVSIAERQARVLAQRQGRSTEKVQQTEIVEPKNSTPAKRSSKIREAAVAAINNAVEQENTVDVEFSPVEELQSNEKIQSLKTKAANLGDKSSEPAKVDSNPDSMMIREMLLSGMSVEEISKETGLGRGAIELVQQMARRQLERK